MRGKEGLESENLPSLHTQALQLGNASKLTTTNSIDSKLKDKPRAVCLTKTNNSQIFQLGGNIVRARGRGCAAVQRLTL